MDFSRYKLLSGAGLTPDQHGGIGRCYYLNLADDSPPSSALTDDFAKCPSLTSIFVVQADGVPDRLQQIFVVKGFGQKVYCPSLDCSDRHRDITMTTEKDNRHPYIFLRQLVL